MALGAVLAAGLVSTRGAALAAGAAFGAGFADSLGAEGCASVVAGVAFGPPLRLKEFSPFLVHGLGVLLELLEHLVYQPRILAESTSAAHGRYSPLFLAS